MAADLQLFSHLHFGVLARAQQGAGLFQVISGQGFRSVPDSEAHAGKVVTLKDIQAARRTHRRALRTAIHERVARVVDFLPVQAQSGPQADAPKPSRAQPQTKLCFYQEDER
jgi:putative transposase